MKKRKKINLWNKVIITIISIYLLLNILMLIKNQTYLNNNYKYISEPDADTKALVIAAHQDDETLVAGGYIIKTIKNGGEVYVLFTVDGATRNQTTTQEDILNITITRENEAKKSLGLAGVDEDKIIFLRNENQKALMSSSSLKENIDIIGTLIKDINPNIIFLAAYEGGHCDHDMTNFAVSQAMKKYNITIPVYESPEYTKYNSFYEEFLIQLNKISIIKLNKKPQFLYYTNDILKLNMTKEEIELKYKMLNQYESQDIDSLKEIHKTADIYRPLNEYNYSQPPYENKKTFRYYYCKIRGRDNCDTFNICQITFDEMKKVMGNVSN